MNIVLAFKDGLRTTRTRPLLFVIVLLLISSANFCVLYFGPNLIEATQTISAKLPPIYIITEYVVFELVFWSLAFFYLISIRQKNLAPITVSIAMAFRMIKVAILGIGWILIGLLKILPAFRRLILLSLAPIKLVVDGQCNWNDLKAIEEYAGNKWVDLLWLLFSVFFFIWILCFIPMIIPGAPTKVLMSIRSALSNLIILVILSKQFRYFHAEPIPGYAVQV